MTKAEILQAIQAEFGNDVTVEFQDGKITITFPNGTVKTINVTPEGFGEDVIPADVSDPVQGTGATHYDDDMGDLIDLLDPQGVIPPVEMSFSVPELENDLSVFEQVVNEGKPVPVVIVDDEPEIEPEGDPDPGPGPNPDPDPGPDPNPDPEPEPEPDTPPLADSVTTPAETSGEIPSGLALLLLSEEIPIAFKQFNVTDEIGDDDNFQGPVDMGGSDAETALGDLVFTYNGDINYGTLVLESGGVFTVMTAGTTYTSADIIWWLATESDAEQFEILPDATFTYSVTDADGNIVNATVVITVTDGDLPVDLPPPPADCDEVDLETLLNTDGREFNHFEIDVVHEEGQPFTVPFFGTTGDDWVLGSNLGDEIHGGEGDDYIDGGNGVDEIWGDAGNDILLGGNAGGGDIIHGGDDNDLIVGGNSGNELYGDDGDDIIFAGNGKDFVDGGKGNDIIFGENGKDELYGDEGDDCIYGGQGNDELYGEDGDDHLIGGDGTDYLDGGKGNDILVVDLLDLQYGYVDGGDDFDRVDLADAGNSHDVSSWYYVIDVELLDMEDGAGDDTMYLSADDVMDMTEDDELFITGDDGDKLFLTGGYENDLLNGHNGEPEWEQGEEDYTGPDGNDYDVYFSDSVTVYVDTDIMVETGVYID